MFTPSPGRQGRPPTILYLLPKREEIIVPRRGTLASCTWNVTMGR